MFYAPFSFEGRIRRSEFGISFIIYAVAYVILVLSKSSKTGGSGIYNLALIPMLWFLWAQGAKRCHDIGKSGYWQIIPFYVFWLLFVDGVPGDNEYGSNPKGIDLPQDVYSAPSENSPFVNKED